MAPAEAETVIPTATCDSSRLQEDFGSPGVIRAALRTFPTAAPETCVGVSNFEGSPPPTACQPCSSGRMGNVPADRHGHLASTRAPLRCVPAEAGVLAVQETLEATPAAGGYTQRLSPTSARAIWQEQEPEERADGSGSTEERPRIPSTSLGMESDQQQGNKEQQRRCCDAQRSTAEGKHCSAGADGGGQPDPSPQRPGTEGQPGEGSHQLAERAGIPDALGLRARPSEDQSAEQREATTLQSNSSGAPRSQRSHSDPDYEIPRGVLTETQVLKQLAQQHQELRNRPLQVDKYGFVLRTGSLDQEPGAEPRSPEAEAASSRRASGAAASTSGRAREVQGEGNSWPENLRRRQAQQAQQQLQEQSLGRLRKWRKMLGPRGGSVVSYWRRNPAKFKRRVRKGIPEQLRGLAWFAMSGGKMLMEAHPPGTFERLAADAEEAITAPVHPANAPSTAPPAAPAAVSYTGEQAAPPNASPETLPLGSAGAATGSGLAANAASAHQGTAGLASPAPAVVPPRSGDPEWDAGWMQAVKQARDPLWRQEALDPAVGAAIMRDLNRTFPKNVYFMQRQGPGQRALYTVLRAYAVFEPGVGYVQGMGFLAAVLLMYLDAREAFWTLVALMHGPRRWNSRGLKWLYTPGMPGLQCCLFQFKHLLRDVAPRLSERMDREGVDPALYATHWFNTAFAYTLPFGHLLRVWDVLLAEGFKTLFRVGLAVLQYAEPRLARLSFEALVEGLSAKNLPALLPEDPEDLLRRALKIPVTQRLRELEAEWQAAQRMGPRPPEPRDKGPWRAAKRVGRLLRGRPGAGSKGRGGRGSGSGKKKGRAT